MAQLVNLLLHFAFDTRLGEVGAVAKTDEGVAPVLGLRRGRGRGQAHDTCHQKCLAIRFL
ncbi:hypothetical protein D3C75_1305490 [compost metagenome]